ACALVASAACGGSEFTSTGGNGGTGGGGADGGGGGVDSGGGTGDSGGSGDGGVTNDGGSADATSTCPQCKDTEDCNTQRQTCTPCTDLNRLVFGSPKKLAVSDGPGQNQAFPRVHLDGLVPRMVYQFESAANGTDLATSTEWVTTAGTPLAQINSSRGDE